MTTALLQPDTNPPPQLPGRTTLRYDTAGDPGVLVHDMGEGVDVFHTRFMIDASHAAGGTIRLAGGIDPAGDAAWHLVLEPDSASVTLQVGSITQSAGFPDAIAWHTVEVGVDALAGSATLRIDGIERASFSAPATATRYVWLGGAFPEAGLTGTIDLDRWVLATEPIGVAKATALHDYAGDPRRWLVVYNRNNPDSAAFAEAYRQRRSLPCTNLCGLDLPGEEAITAAEFESMRQQLNDFLDGNNLRDLIVGVLLGFGVPGYADVAGQGTLTPITSYLQTDDTHGFAATNSLYQDTIAERPAASDYQDARLTGRIDAASLGNALEMLDRADAVVGSPLSHDQAAELVIDINPDDPGVGPLYTEPVADWARGMGLATLRLPSSIYDILPPGLVNGESVVWGWRDAAPPAGFFASPAGRRVVCMQFDPDPEPAVSLRTPSGTDWLTVSLQAGYAAAAAPSRAYSIGALPMPHRFFEALRRGWTIAEAWMLSQSFLRDGLQLVGDPLMTVGFPKAGYDVFGPVDRLDQIDFNQPTAVLHAGEHALTLEELDTPSQPDGSRYVVRRYDTLGRADLANASTYASVADGVITRPALPAWPNHNGWPVPVRKGLLEITTVWPASAKALGVEVVQLESQTEGAEPQTIQDAVFVTGQKQAVFRAAPPTETTRYRLRTIQGPANFHTPWSEWVGPTTPAAGSLTLLEHGS